MKTTARFGLALVACGTALALALPAAAPANWRDAPVVPKLNCAETKRIGVTLRRGQRLGNRADVFAKVGDSLSQSPAFLQSLGCRRWSPGEHASIESTVARFASRGLRGKSADCARVNSFSRNSAATLAGKPSSWPLTPGSAANPVCGTRETPLACEIRLTRPGYAVILFGTNDVALGNALGFDPLGSYIRNVGRLIAATRARGVVPIVSTIPPLPTNPKAESMVEELNAGLYRLAAVRRLPVVNLWRALVDLPNGGISADGVHPSLYRGPQCIATCDPETCAPTCESANFSAAGLQFGWDARNLITLLTLRRVSRVADRVLA